jgi:hypothetical protein
MTPRVQILIPAPGTVVRGENRCGAPVGANQRVTDRAKSVITPMCARPRRSLAPALALVLVFRLYICPSTLTGATASVVVPSPTWP